ncbi:SH3 domain-containing protein [Bartonella sp. CB189]|uniref:SH3 domain-containing protein n=1 Tax=Bartonella sp. CB189 TaxID=3112254 RepID=UPI002F96C4AF
MSNKNFLSTTVIISSLIGFGLGGSVSYVNARTVAHVAAGQAVLRTGPAKTYKIIAIAPVGAKVKINGCLPNKSWCSLQYNGRVGWTSARYLNVNNIPTVFFKQPMHYVNKNPMMQISTQEGVKQPVSSIQIIKVPKRIHKQMQKRYRRNANVDPTGVKKGDERTILNPLPNTKAQNISVKHVTAYNPMFIDDVNFKNFERNETRYRVVTYPIP